jgi:CHAT domain-containing protein
MSHRYLAADLSIAKWLEERRSDSTLRLLLASSDPHGDLPGAGEEYERIEALARSMAGVVVDGLRDGQATRPALLSALRSGRYDVFHFAGHAFFDEADPASSGIVTGEGGTLTGADLAGVSNLPALMFFNACEAARVRRPPARTRAVVVSTGVAEAFLRGGVANYVGTYWPVSDAAALSFASRFYAALFDGRAIGAAVLAARAAVRALQTSRLQRDWADYVHYGNPRFVLKL